MYYESCLRRQLNKLVTIRKGNIVIIYNKVVDTFLKI